MNKTITILISGIQVLLTFIATCTIYMFFAFLDNDFGFDGLFGLIFIQPVLAIILSCLTILACLIIGLPIRLNDTINYWWTTHFYVSILGIITGVAFLSLSLLPNLRNVVTVWQDDYEIVKHMPNEYLFYSGWLLTAFSTLHLYPSKQITDKVKNIISAITDSN